MSYGQAFENAIFAAFVIGAGVTVAVVSISWILYSHLSISVRWIW